MPKAETSIGETGGGSAAVVQRRSADVDAGFEAEDLKSTCGTPVNGRKIGRERVRLHPGDAIQIGRCVFVYHETTAIELADEPSTGPRPETDG